MSYAANTFQAGSNATTAVLPNNTTLQSIAMCKTSGHHVHCDKPWHFEGAPGAGVIDMELVGMRLCQTLLRVGNILSWMPGSKAVRAMSTVEPNVLGITRDQEGSRYDTVGVSTNTNFH